MGTKPGWKTSEFWGKTIIQILSVIGLFRNNLDPKYVMIVTAGLEAVYHVIRTFQKATTGTTDLPEEAK